MKCAELFLLPVFYGCSPSWWLRGGWVYEGGLVVAVKVVLWWLVYEGGFVAVGL